MKVSWKTTGLIWLSDRVVIRLAYLLNVVDGELLMTNGQTVKVNERELGTLKAAIREREAAEIFEC